MDKAGVLQSDYRPTETSEAEFFALYKTEKLRQINRELKSVSMI